MYGKTKTGNPYAAIEVRRRLVLGVLSSTLCSNHESQALEPARSTWADLLRSFERHAA